MTPKACTILLRGPSKDILNEIDRNLADAKSIARNVVFNPTLVPGGDAVQMAISVGLHTRARAVTGAEVSPQMDVILHTLMRNAGGNAIWTLTALRVRLFSSLSIPYFTPSNDISVLFYFSPGKTCEGEHLYRW